MNEITDTYSERYDDSEKRGVSADFPSDEWMQIEKSRRKALLPLLEREELRLPSDIQSTRTDILAYVDLHDDVMGVCDDTKKQLTTLFAGFWMLPEDIERLVCPPVQRVFTDVQIEQIAESFSRTLESRADGYQLLLEFLVLSHLAGVMNDHQIYQVITSLDFPHCINFLQYFREHFPLSWSQYFENLFKFLDQPDDDDVDYEGVAHAVMDADTLQEAAKKMTDFDFFETFLCDLESLAQSAPDEDFSKASQSFLVRCLEVIKAQLLLPPENRDGSIFVDLYNDPSSEDFMDYLFCLAEEELSHRLPSWFAKELYFRFLQGSHKALKATFFVGHLQNFRNLGKATLSESYTHEYQKAANAFLNALESYCHSQNEEMDEQGLIDHFFSSDELFEFFVFVPFEKLENDLPFFGKDLYVFRKAFLLWRKSKDMRDWLA